MSIDEIKPYRMLVGGRAKAEQIRATGAKYCVAPCANCKKQLRELMEDHHIDCQIVGLHDLLYKAIIFDRVLTGRYGEWKPGLISDAGRCSG